MPYSDYIKLATDYILFLRKKGLKFNRHYLFGSYANGTETKDSDIDILLISNFFLFPDEKQFHYLYDITKEYNNKIHLHFMSSFHFNITNPNPHNNYFSTCFDSIIDYHYPIFIPSNNK